jgi:hypothetical protein
MSCVMAASVALVAGQAMAHPPGHGSGGARPHGGYTDQFPFNDNFDAYTAGSGISTNGTWQLWDPAVSADGVVDSTFASSAPNSFKTMAESDNVQLGDITSGRWRLRAMTYMPSNNPGGLGYIIGVNTFPTSENGNWSMQIQWNPAAATVSCVDVAGLPTTPIVYDQWVAFRCEIDLDADTYSAWYNDVQIVTDRSWSMGNQPTGGVARIQCLDFYSQGQSDLQYDDVVLEAIGTGPACYANCDGSTGTPFLNVNDFICFQAKFAAGDSYANCDGSTGTPTLNVNDFICFQGQFAAGCSAP